VILIIRYSPTASWDLSTWHRAAGRPEGAPTAAAPLQLRQATVGATLCEVSGLSEYVGGSRRSMVVDMSGEARRVHCADTDRTAPQATNAERSSQVSPRRTAGRILLDGPVSPTCAASATAAGLGRTFQNIRLFVDVFFFFFFGVGKVESGAERPGNRMLGKGGGRGADRTRDGSADFVGLGGRANGIDLQFFLWASAIDEIARALAANQDLCLMLGRKPADGWNQAKSSSSMTLLKRVAAPGHDHPDHRS